MNNNERMHTGQLYLCTDPELMKRQAAQMELLYDYNHKG